jgi:alkylation response protein AidB-like acyl-CoA dehydrogenase
MRAEGVVIGADAMLGADGQGFDIMMGTVLPYFQLMNAAVSLGVCDAATAKTIAHLTTTRYERLDQTLKEEMRAGRQGRLEKLGFSAVEAEDLSALHTRNFM